MTTSCKLAVAGVTVINAAKDNNQTVVRVAASRPICDGCASAIESVGAEAASPLKYIRPIPIVQEFQ